MDKSTLFIILPLNNNIGDNPSTLLGTTASFINVEYNKLHIFPCWGGGGVSKVYLKCTFLYFYGVAPLL